MARNDVQPKTISVARHSRAFQRLGIQRTTHEGVRHALILEFVRGPKFMPMAQEVESTLLCGIKWHSRASINLSTSLILLLMR